MWNRCIYYQSTGVSTSLTYTAVGFLFQVVNFTTVMQLSWYLRQASYIFFSRRTSRSRHHDAWTSSHQLLSASHKLFSTKNNSNLYINSQKVTQLMLPLIYSNHTYVHSWFHSLFPYKSMRKTDTLSCQKINTCEKTNWVSQGRLWLDRLIWIRSRVERTISIGWRRFGH